MHPDEEEKKSSPMVGGLFNLQKCFIPGNISMEGFCLLGLNGKNFVSVCVCCGGGGGSEGGITLLCQSSQVPFS